MCTCVYVGRVGGGCREVFTSVCKCVCVEGGVNVCVSVRGAHAHAYMGCEHA